MALTPLLLILLFRWFTYRVLWKVRNRLILTYLLMGLAPVVMVVTLAAIAAYLLAGQYATDLGTSQVNPGADAGTRRGGQCGGVRDAGRCADGAGGGRMSRPRRAVQPIREVQPQTGQIWPAGRREDADAALA